MTEPRARIIEVNGQLVLDDPDAYAFAKVVGKHNCKATLNLNKDRMVHFAKRVHEKGLKPKDVVIVVINIDDRYGDLGEALTPGVDWQEIRDRGEIPFARGLAGREGIQAFLDDVDAESAKKLRESDGIAIMVADHQFTEVFNMLDLWTDAKDNRE